MDYCLRKINANREITGLYRGTTFWIDRNETQRNNFKKAKKVFVVKAEDSRLRGL